MFFHICKSCQRPPLPDMLILFSLIFIGAIALLLAYFAFTTIFS